MSSLINNERGGYAFLPGIEPYSSGVIADERHEIIHATLAEPVPWHAGLLAAKSYLESNKRECFALCGVELRCPEPHSIGGFVDFNKDYRALLDEWEIPVDGENPVARTNVAPVVDPPSETMLHAFSYTVPSSLSYRTFVVAGGGELPTRKLDRDRIVRVGETSADAMLEKAECVIKIMRHRLEHLDADEERLSAIDVYTAHELLQPLTDKVIPGIPAASRVGVQWFLTRPPVAEIEFEMDMRGVQNEIRVDLR